MYKGFFPVIDREKYKKKYLKCPAAMVKKK